jgi:hypothetical protein
VYLSTSSRVDVQGVRYLSLSTASSVGVHGVTLSTSNGMDVQGVSLSTTSIVDRDACVLPRRQHLDVQGVSFSAFIQFFDAGTPDCAASDLFRHR